MSKEEYIIKDNINTPNSNIEEINKDLKTSPTKESKQNEHVLIQEKNSKKRI